MRLRSCFTTLSAQRTRMAADDDSIPTATQSRTSAGAVPSITRAANANRNGADSASEADNAREADDASSAPSLPCSSAADKQKRGVSDAIISLTHLVTDALISKVSGTISTKASDILRSRATS